MTERWEREVRKLRTVEPREHVIRERAAQGASWDRRGLRRNALVAGVVAGAVAIAGVAFLWQLDEGGREIGGGASDLPTLQVTFESNGSIVNQPDEQVQRVDTTIVYGSAREQSFTSIISEGAHVDWVGVDDLTRFVPGPTAGSPVQIQADGENARVLIGTPADWPEFDRFTPIEQLPAEPGDYVLLFEAVYPEGVARTARFVSTVSPGVLQLIVTEGKSLHAATALAYLDGTRTDGFLSSSWFTLGDVGAQSDPAVPHFGADAWLEVPPGSPMLLVSAASQARASVFERYEDFVLDAPLASDLLADASVLEGSTGRHLLAVDVTWRRGPNPLREEPTAERAVFFFPIEIVPAIAGVESPTPGTSPTPAPVAADAVVIEILRSSEETGDPEAIARFGRLEQWMCPDGWIVVNPDGTEENRIFNCGQSDVLTAPAGTPIEVTGDFATLNVTIRVEGERVPGSSDVVPSLEAGSILTLTYEVTWDDGSEASFWLLLTVQDDGASLDTEEIVVRIEGLGRSERSRDFPIMTMSFRGETARGCTEAFEWTTADLRKIDEVSGRSGSILVQCSYDPLFMAPPRTPIVVLAERGTEVSVTRTTTPLYAGIDGVGVSVTWPDGKADFLAYFEVQYDEPVPRSILLDCAPDDRVRFGPPEGPRIQPGGSAYITGNIEGFLPHDVVEQMTRRVNGDTEWDGVWQVVRGGLVVAMVSLPTLGGAACLGSGVAGV